MRSIRRMGPRRRSRQDDLLRPLCAATPRPGSRRHRGCRRFAGAGVQGSRPGQSGLRGADAGRDGGHGAIGQCRHSHSGQPTWENAQPVFRTTAAGTGVALGHNGNLVNSAELVTRAREAGLINSKVPGAATTDSDMLGALLAHGAADSSLEQAALQLLPTVRGAFCLTFMDENTLYAARDPWGVRPLCLGRLDRGWVVASETAALDI